MVALAMFVTASVAYGSRRNGMVAGFFCIVFLGLGVFGLFQALDVQQGRNRVRNSEALQAIVAPYEKAVDAQKAVLFPRVGWLSHAQVAQARRTAMARMQQSDPAYRTWCANALSWQIMTLQPESAYKSEYLTPQMLFVDDVALTNAYTSGRGIGSRTRELLLPFRDAAGTNENWRECFNPKFLG